CQGYRATQADWEAHLNTLFPEVRLKKTLEVRGADSQRPSLISAVPALWKGLLYDASALEQAEKLTDKLQLGELAAARPEIAQRALEASLSGRKVAKWAAEVLEIAKSGLDRFAEVDTEGNDETVYLRRLSELVMAGKCPTDDVLEHVRDPMQLLRHPIAQD